MKHRVLCAAFCLLAANAYTQPQPKLVVLQPTGASQGGLPVLQRHPQGAVVERALMRGFSGRLLRLYAMEQEYLRRRDGTPPEPAYLLLSARRGGFPMFGFVLDGVRKPRAGYVDLYQTRNLTGYFGAADQIFPHELLHIIARQLAGEPRESGANQVHAIGVRTDPVTAFNEGLAEHVQILCVDDPDAAAATRALIGDRGLRSRAEREFAGFARDLQARAVLVSPSRLRFLLWFSQSEQVLRYWAVKDNAFARQPAIPARLLDRKDKYAAYLFRSVVPGAPGDPARGAGELLATEGVVAHLFWRFVTSPDLGRHVNDDAFYEAFGTRVSDLTPIENVYLKLFHAMYEGKPSDAAGLLRAYVAAYPGEAVAVDALVRDTLLGQDLPAAPEIWLANEQLLTGTSLFDQYRGMPRVHTFDINAASHFDWLAVDGVSPDAARRLVAGVPYRSLDDLSRVPGVDPALRVRVREMEAAMAAVYRKAHEEEASLSLSAIATPYVWRFLAVIAIASMAGTWLARRSGMARWWSASLTAVVSTVLVLAFAWVIVSPPWMPVAAPPVVAGVPAALWTLVRHRSPARAIRALAAAAAAMIPALLLSRVWF